MDLSDFDNKYIKLIEVMNSWQGEGPNTGRQMLICRFKFCNLRCHFCDTMIKMTTAIEGSYSINDLNQALEKTRGLMITGGEPTFSNDKNDNYQQTLDMLNYCNYQTANIETNGYRIVDLLKEVNNSTRHLEVNVMWSPKVFNIRQFHKFKDDLEQVATMSSLYLKIVIDSDKWCEEVVKHARNVFGFDRSKIYLMPCGSTKEAIDSSLTRTVDLADDYACNISTRLHIVSNFI